MKLYSMMLAVTLVRGEGLAAKDRNWRGQKTSSDPYVIVEIHTKRSPNSEAEIQKIFQTKTVKKTLDPVWMETGKLKEPMPAEVLQDESNPPILVLRLFDHDMGRKDDSMGVINIPLEIATKKETKDYNVPASSAKGAKGKVTVTVDTKLLYGAGDPAPMKLGAVGAVAPNKRAKGRLDLFGISVHYLSTAFMEEIYHAGLTDKSRIYEIENLQGPEGIIRKKGKEIVCPITKKKGAAYVHCLEKEDDVGLATHMLSYTWGYQIGDIVLTLVDFCQSNKLDPKRTYIWICCLCVNQHRVVEMNNSGTLGESDVDFEKEFRDRVLGVGHILPMMAPWDSPFYLTRVWCIFEIYTAMQNDCKVSILMPPKEKAEMTEKILGSGEDGNGGATALYEALANTKVEHAEASVEEDRKMILGMLEKGAGFVATNTRVNEYIRSWVRSTVDNIIETRARETGATATKEDKLKLAKLRVQVGSLFDRYGDHDAALTMFYKAQKLVKDAGGSLFVEATLWNHIGLALDAKGKYAEAYAMHGNALSIYKTLFGAEDERTTSSANNMGMNLKDLGKLDAALQVLKENLDVRKRTLDQNHPDLAISYSNVGVTLQELGDLDGAQEAFETCLSIRLKAFGANHPEIAGTRSNLGFIMMMRGKLDEAELELNKCLQFYEVSMGKDHPECARIHQNLGGLYQQMQKFPESLCHFERAGDILKASVGENNLLMARNHDCRGDLLMLMNKDDAAMAQLEASLRILRAVCGPDHREVASPLMSIGACYVRQNEYGKAHEKLMEALRIQETAQGVDPSKLAETRAFVEMVKRKLDERTGVPSRGKAADNGTKAVSFEEAEKIFVEWRGRFFDAERGYRELYYKGGNRGDAMAVDTKCMTLLSDAQKLGVQHGMSKYFAPYIIILQELHGTCGQLLRSGTSIRPQGSQTEAIGELAGRKNPMSEADASRHPAFVEWKNELFAIEKSYHALLRKANSRGEEFGELTQKFRLRIIWTDVVEEAVGFAPLKPYMALIQAYERVLKPMEVVPVSNAAIASTTTTAARPKKGVAATAAGRHYGTSPTPIPVPPRPFVPQTAANKGMSTSSPQTVSLLQTTIRKTGPSDKTGISMANMKGKDGKMFPVVTRVMGASAKTSLPGLRIHTVNGVACRDCAQAVQALGQAGAGAVTVTAGSHNTMVAWVQNMGFSISEFQGGGLGLNVGSLSAEQQASSGLKEGMMILQVNGVYVTNLDKAGIVAAMVNQPNGLTVVAMEKPPGRYKLALSVENPSGLPALQGRKK